MHGHINLVHCLSHGESWMLDNLIAEKKTLSKPENESVLKGTGQFWRVLAMLLNDDCDVINGCNTPLGDANNIDVVFSHLVNRAKSKEQRKNWIKEKIWTLCESKEKCMVLVDMSPVPAHNGVENTMIRCSQKGMAHSDHPKKSPKKNAAKMQQNCVDHLETSWTETHQALSDKKLVDTWKGFGTSSWCANHTSFCGRAIRCTPWINSSPAESQQTLQKEKASCS